MNAIKNMVNRLLMPLMPSLLGTQGEILNFKRGGVVGLRK